MSEVVVVAEIPIADGKRDEALSVLERLCADTHANDDGCLLYALQLDPADESHLFMIEKWASQEALQAHMTTDHMRVAGESGVMSGAPKIWVLNQAGFGDVEKGSL